MPECFALGRWPELERGLGDLDGALVASGGAAELGGLPQPVAAVLPGGGVADVVPQLEGSLEVGEGGTGGDRLGGVGGGEEGDERSCMVAGPVEVEGELPGPVGAAELRRGLLRRPRSAAHPSLCGPRSRRSRRRTRRHR